MTHSDVLNEGWKLWRAWHLAIAPENYKEINALEADKGEYLGYVRTIARRKPGLELPEPILSLPSEYSSQPLLRTL